LERELRAAREALYLFEKLGRMCFDERDVRHRLGQHVGARRAFRAPAHPQLEHLARERRDGAAVLQAELPWRARRAHLEQAGLDHGPSSAATSACRSSADGTQAPASTFCRTCSGEVAPAITDATHGIAASPPIATCSIVRPRSSA